MNRQVSLLQPHVTSAAYTASTRYDRTRRRVASANYDKTLTQSVAFRMKENQGFIEHFTSRGVNKNHGVPYLPFPSPPSPPLPFPPFP